VTDLYSHTLSVSGLEEPHLLFDPGRLVGDGAPSGDVHTSK
jgi:hypothetical protein